jgi:hypothetical protein
MLIYQYFTLVKLAYFNRVSYFVILTFDNHDTKHLQLITNVILPLKLLLINFRVYQV